MLDLSTDQAEKRAPLDADARLGVQIDHPEHTRARPDPSFCRPRPCQLAIVQRAEQTERQALAERRQRDGAPSTCAWRSRAGAGAVSSRCKLEWRARSSTSPAH